MSCMHTLQSTRPSRDRTPGWRAQILDNWLWLGPFYFFLFFLFFIVISSSCGDFITFPSFFFPYYFPHPAPASFIPKLCMDYIEKSFLSGVAKIFTQALALVSSVQRYVASSTGGAAYRLEIFGGPTCCCRREHAQQCRYICTTNGMRSRVLCSIKLIDEPTKFFWGLFFLFPHFATKAVQHASEKITQSKRFDKHSRTQEGYLMMQTPPLAFLFVFVK